MKSSVSADRRLALARTAEQEEPGAGQARAPRARRRPLHRVAAEALAKPVEHRLGSRLRGDHHRVEAGRLHLAEQLLRRAQRVDAHRGERDPEIAPPQLAAERQRRLHRHVEGRVDQLEGARAGDPRHALDLVDHLAGGAHPVQTALEAGIGTVDAPKAQPRFDWIGQVNPRRSYAPPVDPALEARRSEAGQAARSESRLDRPDSSRDATPGRRPGSSPCVERREQSREGLLPFAEDGEVRAQDVEAALAEQRHRRPADHHLGAAAAGAISISASWAWRSLSSRWWMELSRLRIENPTTSGRSSRNRALERPPPAGERLDRSRNRTSCPASWVAEAT